MTTNNSSVISIIADAGIDGRARRIWRSGDLTCGLTPSMFYEFLSSLEYCYLSSSSSSRSSSSSSSKICILSSSSSSCSSSSSSSISSSSSSSSSSTSSSSSSYSSALCEICEFIVATSEELRVLYDEEWVGF